MSHDRLAARLHTLLLVRHGQSEWNARGWLQGRTPHVPLTPAGIAQAEAAAAALAGRGVSVVVTSDQLRARQTADAIARVLGVRARPDTSLRERGFGRYEGRPARDLDAAEPPGVARDPDRRPGGGESLRDVYHRVGGLLATLLQDPPGRVVALVSHGDTIRAATAWLQGHAAEQIPSRVPPNGSITTVRLHDGAAASATTDLPGAGPLPAPA